MCALQADAQPRPRALGSQPAYAQQQQQQRKWLPENVPVVGCPVRAVMADEALERLGGLDRWRCRICRDHGYAGYITMRGKLKKQRSLRCCLCYANTPRLWPTCFCAPFQDFCTGLLHDPSINLRLSSLQRS